MPDHIKGGQLMRKDHYLDEDFDLTIEHLEALQKTSLQIQQCAAKADFIHMQQMQDKLSVSLKILKTLSNKKLNREQMNVSETIRRSYF